MEYNMAEPTFAQQAVEPEKTESERIRERIQNFKSSISPNILGVIQMMLDNQMKSGMIKPADLDAIVVLRDEINKAQIDYNTQVQQAQTRLQSLAEQEQAEQVARNEAAVQAIRDGETAERQRRKIAEEKLSNMEAVLLSHGISMDLNNDGVVGLNAGQVARQLTDDEKAQVDAMVNVEKANIATAPIQPTLPKAPSRAFQMARMMNPATEETEENVSEDVQSTVNETNTELFHKEGQTKTEFDAQVEAARKSFAEWTEDNKIELDDEANEGFTPSGTTTVEFLDEVERVNEVADADETEMKTAVTPVPSAPIISAEQRPNTDALLDMPNVTEEGSNIEPAPSIPTYDSEEEMLAAAQSRIDNAVEDEEEYDEVTIPSESELKAMTKTGILAQGTMLEFNLDIKDTKAVMISSFLTQVDKLIADLQDSGEFVSAASTEEEKDDSVDRQDGGYF
jgi:hypothetical protein